MKKIIWKIIFTLGLICYLQIFWGLFAYFVAELFWAALWRAIFCLNSTLDFITVEGCLLIFTIGTLVLFLRYLPMRKWIVNITAIVIIAHFLRIPFETRVWKIIFSMNLPGTMDLKAVPICFLLFSSVIVLLFNIAFCKLNRHLKLS